MTPETSDTTRHRADARTTLATQATTADATPAAENLACPSQLFAFLSTTGLSTAPVNG